MGSLTREELEAEVLRLRGEQVQGPGTAFGRPVRSTPIGHDELFSAIEKTRMPMILTDPRQPDDPIVFANRAFQQLSGYGADELLGRNCRFLQGPGTDPADVQRIRDALAARSDLAIDLLNYRKDGTPFLNELYISPVLDTDGRVIYNFGSQVDVTGHRKDRKALEASERRQRSVFDSALDFAIVVTDRDGTITDWNTGAEHVMGWTAGEMRGRDAASFFTPDDNANGRVAYEMETALADGRASDERWHLKKGGERFWASGEMMPLRDEADAHIGFVKIMRDRTDEHLAGVALAEAEADLRRAQAAGGVGLFAVDIPGGTLRPTPEFCRLYGLPERDAYPSAAFETLIVPEDAHLVSSAASRARGDAQPDVEYRIRRADTGELRWIARRGEIERDASGRPLRFAGASRDVTARRRADETLRSTQDRFRTLLETVETAFAIVEVKFDADDRPVDYRFLEANPAFEHQAGVNLRGKWVSEFAPDLERFWFETYGRVARTGEPASFENYAEAFGRWFDVRAVRVGDPAERQIAILFDDVTERRAIQARNAATVKLGDRLPDLTESREIAAVAAQVLGEALGASLVGYGTVDVDAETILVEQDWSAEGLQTLPGLIRSREYGSYFDDLLRGETVVVIDAVADPRTAGFAADLEAIGARAFVNLPLYERGRFVALLYVGYARPRAWADDEIVFLRDVAERVRAATERARREKDLRVLNETLESRVAERTADLLQAEDQLRQSQKMEAVGQLTGGVAHDFNNLLTIIRSSVDFLRRPDLPEERRRRYMDAVSDTVERAAKLTGQLLAFARRQALKPEVLDVGERLRAVADMIDTVTGSRVRVVTEVPDAACFVRVDVSQFETALINMAVNARDAMEGAGTLTLRLTCGVPIPQIRGHAGGPEPFARIGLSDTGSGIADADLVHIFEPFFTTKEVGKGTGLGLSQVFGFAKQSGGDVDVSSEVGRGTTFSLYLPQVEAEADEDAGDADDGPAPGGRGLRVLVVEDNIEVGQFATQILDDLGYRCEWAPNAETALERLGGDGGGFDAVFSDVVMPGMGGIALAEELRRRLPRLPVVLASGYSHVLAQDGGHGFELLHKPYSADQLSKMLQGVIGRRRTRTRR